jgi:2-alkyl-3-oxoalkanoate reductase
VIAPRLAAVTGGTGLLGRAIVARLLAEGWRVRLLLRSPDEAASRGVVPVGVETVFGGLADAAALERLVAGADAVIHSAMVNRARSEDDYYDINVEASYRLGLAVRAWAPVARLVVVSSLVARFPWLSAHAASRADGEDAVIDTAGNRSWAVLRLGPIYGPGDRKTLLMMEAATWPVMPIPDLPQASISPLHLDDAATAIVGACGAGQRGAVWDVGEGEYSWLDIARAVRRSVGEAPLLVRVPTTMVSLAVALTHPLGAGETPLLSPGRMCEMFHEDWTARPQHRPPEAVWRPRLRLEAGLFATADWFRVNGWLKQPETLSASRLRGY